MDDDKGGGDEDVEADGWEEGAGDHDIVVRDGVDFFLVASGQWCVVSMLMATRSLLTY